MLEMPSSAQVSPVNRDTRLADLKRMRMIATLLLVLMTVVFVVTTLHERDWPWIPYLRAFAEAGMVGACADWFAVVALFRHPFGIPIPHTAIVPNNKARIGASAGRFITNNFLSARVVNQRLVQVDAVGWIAHWISDAQNSSRLAHYVSGMLPKILASLPAARLSDIVGAVARGGIAAIPAAPLASKALSILWAQGEAQALIEQAIAYGESSLVSHKDFINRKVAQQSSRWIPKWVDNMIAERIVSGLIGTLAEMRDPGHPWRLELRQAVSKLVSDLATDPQMQARGEELKAELLANPLFLDQVSALWAEIETGLYAELPARVEAIAATLEAGLRALGKWMEEDKGLRSRLNRWLRLVVLRVLVPRRAEIGAYVSTVIQNWNSTTLVDRLELQVGKDLQYIRINGTLVGGLVGLFLFIASKWIAVP
ncbi:Uncharacterized membrane-anchored protein YjiN, DUF445 family [Rhizobiales bacterium GAS113]|nr:Uncharacterized membrane-anchored protein YjiN, DUF445 family [Rhizobiales bacterium GAS113]